MIVYVSIGNSDDKLPQQRWAAFITDIRATLRRHAEHIHGEWYSAPDAGYQNACFCIGLANADMAEFVKMRIAEIRENYEQTSAAWAIAPETEFV